MRRRGVKEKRHERRTTGWETPAFPEMHLRMVPCCVFISKFISKYVCHNKPLNLEDPRQPDK